MQDLARLTDRAAASVFVGDSVRWTLAHNGAKRKSVENSAFLIGRANIGYCARVLTTLIDTAEPGGTIGVLTALGLYFAGA